MNVTCKTRAHLRASTRTCGHFDVSLVAFICGIGLGTPAVVHAQEPARLEEMVVTAQKRGENIQKVPLTVSAFSGDEITRASVANVKDLAKLDPALNITQGSGVIVPFMRGIGNPSGTTAGNEASAPVYIDDVYYARLTTADMALASIERVEVLKGPQGTLFGRNASAGLIQVFTRDPGPTPTGDLTFGYGNFDTKTLKFYGSMPITDRLSANLSVAGQKQGKGWGTNHLTGEETFINNYINVRSKILYEPTDSTRIRLNAYYVEEANGQGLVGGGQLFRGTVRGTPGIPAFGILPYGPIQPVFPFDKDHFYDADANLLSQMHTKSGGASVKIDQETPWFDFTSISAFRRSEGHFVSEGDHTPFNWLWYTLDNLDQEMSQEFQLKSKPEKQIQWILGAYLFNARQGFEPTAVRGDVLDITAGGVPGIHQDIYGMQTISSWATFGQATLPVVDEKTNVTLGLRYTEDKVHGRGHQELNIPNIATIPLQVPEYDKTFVFHKLTYKVAVDHRFTENVMTYASYSRGYKSGTFNTLPLDADPTRPETVDAVELGLKTELFQNRLRLNLAIYRNGVLNPQVQLIKNVAGVASVQFANAEKARTRGVEFSGQALITDDLTFRFGANYTEARFISFKDAPINTFLFVSPFGATTTSGDASGNYLPQVPRYTFTVGANYDVKTSVGSFNFDVGAAYRSSFPWETDNVLKQKAYTLVSTALTYTPSFNEHVSVRLWAENLAGERYYSNELTQTGSVGGMVAPGAPRTYGVEARYAF